MIKKTIFSALILSALFVSYTFAQDTDCDVLISQIDAAKSQYHADYKVQKKAFENWNKYYKELHSESYEATDEPVVDTYKKCKSGELDNKLLCKGATEKYDEISPKEEAARAERDEALAKANKSRQDYNVLVRQASELGCNPKKK